jgi:hypothetical protein
MAHTCHIPTCKVHIQPKLLMCLKHWRLVPTHLQVRVWKTYRPGQEVTKAVTKEYLDAANAAIQAVVHHEAEKQRRQL